jgi:hypothetical protein
VLGLAAGVGVALSRLRRRRALEAALLASLVSGILWGIFSTYLWDPGNVITGVFWLLFVLALARPSDQEGAPRLRATMPSW